MRLPCPLRQSFDSKPAEQVEELRAVMHAVRDDVGDADPYVFSAGGLSSESTNRSSHPPRLATARAKRARSALARSSRSIIEETDVPWDARTAWPHIRSVHTSMFQMMCKSVALTVRCPISNSRSTSARRNRGSQERW